MPPADTVLTLGTMEVFSLLDPGSPQSNDPGFREELVKDILATRTTGGAGVGIYGAEVCQLCGQIDVFSGWASAIGFHFDREFVCPSCTRKVTGGATEMSFRARVVRLRLDAQHHRFCERCTRQITPPRDDAWRRHYLCSTCVRELLDEHGDLDVAAYIGELIRRRYIDKVATTDDELVTFAEGTERMQRRLSRDEDW